MTALLQNTSATESIDLFGASGNITGPGSTGVSLDDADFLNNLPLSLAPSQSYSSAMALSFTSQASTGSYLFTYALDGQGTNSGTPYTGTGSKTIAVTAAASAPEPGGLMLMLSSLWIVVRLHWRRLKGSGTGIVRNRLLWRLSAFLMFLLAVRVWAQVVTTIVNGSFESPAAGQNWVTYSSGQSFNGWTVEYGTVDLSGPHWDAASGQQSVDLSGGGRGGIYQDISTIAGQVYKVRFAVSGNMECAPTIKTMEVRVGQTLIDSISFNGAGRSAHNMGWEYHEYQFIASSSTTRLRFLSTTDSCGGPMLDNVSLQDGDNTAPDTTITTGPVSGTSINTTSASWTYTGSDNQTATANLKYRYRIDGGAWQGPTASTSVTVNSLSQGQHRFEVAAIDEIGNIDPTPAVADFTVDTTPPVFQNGPTVTGVTYNSATVVWTTDDAVGATLEVSLDDGTPFTPILTYTDSRTQSSHSSTIGPLKSNIAYRVRVTAGDAAENKTTTSPVSFTTLPLRDMSVVPADLSFSKAGPADGDSLTLSAVIRNKGDITLNATAVFYDVSPTGTREISRSPVTLVANAANSPTVTSAPFTVAQGDHTPYVQLINIGPGDDIASDNTASKPLPVGAPAQRLSVKVSDISTYPGDDRTVAVVVRNTGSQPMLLGQPSVAGVTFIHSYDPAPTAPLAPGDSATLTLRVQTPAGQPAGTLSNPALTPITVDVNGFTATPNVAVYSGPVASVDVTVVDDTTGLPLSGALVATDGSNILYVTGADGKLRDSGTGLPTTLAAFPGTVTIFGYKSGYVAASVSTAATKGANAVTLRLVPGQTLEVTKVTAHPLTQTEIQQRGVNLTDPANYVVYDFVLYMKIGTISIPNVVYPIGGGGGGGADITSGGGSFQIPEIGNFNVRWQFDPTTHTDTWIVIPGDVRILKQFWDATVFIRNNSATLPVQNVTASLDVPSGLTLPVLDGLAQSLTQSLGTLTPNSQVQASWTLRGDTAGTYRLTGHASGNIVLGGSTIPLSASLQSDPFDVVMPRISLQFTTPAAVTAGDIFTVGITVHNDVPIDLYGVTVNIKSSQLVNCVLAPNETASHYLGMIPVNGSSGTSFRFVSLVTGNVEEVRSYVSPLPVEPDVNVTPALNHAPDAVDDSATTAAETQVTLAPLSNDTDPDGDTLTIAAITQPSHGTAVIGGGGTTIVYTPIAGYSGPDTFTYTISDGHGNSDTATIRLSVVAGSPAQIVLNQVLSITRSGSAIVVVAQLKNTGGSTAQNIVLTGAQLGSASATDNPLPTLGDIAPGATGNVTLTFPSSAGSAGQLVYLRLTATFVGGNTSASRRIALP